MANQFNTSKHSEGTFEPILPQVKKEKRKPIDINGEFDFSGNAFANTKAIGKKQRGRPVSIHDSRYKVSVPKKISPALNSKLSILQDYMTELQSETGRITFEKIIDTLADSYIQHRLGVAKEEHIKDEIAEEFERLKQ